EQRRLRQLQVDQLLPQRGLLQDRADQLHELLVPQLVRGQVDAHRDVPAAVVTPAADRLAHHAHDALEEDVGYTHLLAQWNEIRRTDDGAVRPYPSGECLDTCQASILQVYLRLVKDRDLTVVDCLSQLGFHVELVPRPKLHFAVVEGHVTVRPPHRPV